jgi:hypothetical protein
MSEVQILSPRPNLACAYRRLTRRSRSSLCRRINTTSNLIFLVPIQGSLDSGSLTIEAWGESSDRPRSVLPAKFEEMIHAAAGEVEHEPGQVIDPIPARIQHIGSRWKPFWSEPLHSDDSDYSRAKPIATYIKPTTAPSNSSTIINTIIVLHPLSRSLSQAHSTRHALRMNVVSMISAKIIVPEIVHIAISSLIMFVPVLSVSPS